MNARQLQHALLMAVRHRMRNPTQWVSELGTVLHRSDNAIYKKMQGSTALSLEEVITLCTHYEVPIDPLISSDTITFRRTPGEPCSILDQLHCLRQQIDGLHRCTHVRVWYAEDDIPLCYLLKYPLLVSFRGYISKYSSTPRTRSRRLFLPTRALSQVCSATHQLLHALPSSEFWNECMFDLYLKGIRYAVETTVLGSPETAAELCSLLLRICTDMAGKGCASDTTARPATTASVFHNELQDLNVSLLVCSDSKKCLFLHLGQPAAMHTASGVVIDQYRHRLEALAARSEVLSGGAGRRRKQLLATCRDKILKVQAQLDV